MKKLITLSVVSVMVLSMAGLAFADSFKSPAQTYADLAKVSVEEAYELRGTEKTFGQLASENDLLDDFRKANLESKKSILADMVTNGEMTQEQADEIIKAMEENDCLTPGENRVGQKFGAGFGRALNGQGQGAGQGLRRGNGQGRGNGAGYRFSNNN